MYLAERETCCNKAWRILVFMHGTLNPLSPELKFKFSMPDTELLNLLLIFFVASLMFSSNRTCPFWIALRDLININLASLNESLVHIPLQIFVPQFYVYWMVLWSEFDLCNGGCRLLSSFVIENPAKIYEHIKGEQTQGWWMRRWPWSGDVDANLV